MPHMLAAEHMGYVDALRYGTTRNDATLAAALSAIGSTPAILVPTLTGDGIWTVTGTMTVPDNVTFWVPPGVNFTITGALTLNGPLVAFSDAWFSGAGTLNYNFTGSTNLPTFTRLISKTLTVEGGGQYPMVLGTPTGTGGPGGGKQLLFFNNIPSGPSAGNCGLIFFQPNQTATDGWEVGINTSKQWYIGRPSTFGRMVLTDSGLGLSNVTSGLAATHLLHLAQDDAFKATTLWSVPSDAQLKTVQREATEGLTEIQGMTPVWFTWNGKAGTDPQAEEQLGLIAQQEVGKTPYLFHTYADKLEPDDPAPTTLYSGNYSPLVFMLVNAVKTLAQQVQALTDRVTALENP
jgi:Chaperone of endosialidase